jgi:DNA-directed RNA polymerase I subunit RPA2
MAPAPSARHKRTKQQWSVEYETLRRQRLFRDPPKDRTAYPLLHDAIEPHIKSFNAILEPGGLISEALKDIGTKTFLDTSTPTADADARPANRLSVRIRDVFIDKPELPPSNKFAVKTREIMPAECRERHASYRGRLRARIEYRINNDPWIESLRDFGMIPVMLRVGQQASMAKSPKTTDNGLLEQQMSLGEHDSSSTCHGERRIGRAGRIFHCEWQ